VLATVALLAASEDADTIAQFFDTSPSTIAWLTRTDTVQ